MSGGFFYENIIVIKMNESNNTKIGNNKLKSKQQKQESTKKPTK